MLAHPLWVGCAPGRRITIMRLALKGSGDRRRCGSFFAAAHLALHFGVSEVRDHHFSGTDEKACLTQG